MNICKKNLLHLERVGAIRVSQGLRVKNRETVYNVNYQTS